jgi:glycerol-3-phosphate acyltransferase PlsY
LRLAFSSLLTNFTSTLYNNAPMFTLAWIVAGLVLGSLPFPYLIGKAFLHTDIRSYGDGSPGATNVARAGNKALYVVAALLDAFKGTIPVCLAQMVSGIGGWELAAVGVAPVIGHAFTPFLKFKGGMGVATTFGVWLGLTGWVGPAVMAICAAIAFAVQRNWVWSTMGIMAGLLIFLLALHYPLHLAGTCGAHAAIMAAKRYSYLTSLPELRPWLKGKATQS